MHQGKNYLTLDNTVGTVATQTAMIFNTQDAVNIHGLHMDLSLRADGDADSLVDANVAILCVPEGTTTPTIGDTQINDADFQQFVWYMTKCLVGKSEVVRCLFDPKTSRSCPKETKLVVVVRWESSFDGVPTALYQAGLLSWFETQL